MFFLQSAMLSGHDINIKHYFFSRQGGVSEGDYDSLNCSIKSPDTKVQSNYKIIANSIGFDYNNFKVLKQSHSNNVITVVDRTIQTQDLEADALVSNLPGILLGVYTADCVPLIFQDKDNMVVGIAHAGWRGALAGIINNTISAMRELGAKNIKAAIGPCIRQKNYEIDHEFYNIFLNNNINSVTNQLCIPSPNPNYYLFDLAGYCGLLLRNLDIDFEDSQVDTYANDQLFFSYRRSYHESLKKNEVLRHGCQLSAVGIYKSI